MGALARRVVSMLAIALLATSCGGDESPVAAVDEQLAAEVPSEAPTATREPVPTSVPATPTATPALPTATPVAVDPEEWVAGVNRLLSDQRYEGFLAEVRYILMQEDKGYAHITFDATYWRELGVTHTTFAEGLPEPPPEFADLAEAFKQASLALADRYAVAADDLEADAEAEALDNYELPANWDTYLELNGDAESAVTTACFALRDAVTDSGFGLINCVGGDGGPPKPKTPEDCQLIQRMIPDFQCGDSEDDGDDGDATTVEPGESELAPGATYTFNTFARPFALTIDEPSNVIVRDSEVTIAPIDSDLWSMFWILALDEIADPATYTDNFNDRPALMDLPDDFGAWVEGLPFAVASEGQSTFGDATVPYWRLEAPVERDSPDAFEWYDFAPAGLPLARDGVFWLVPHPDGPLIVYTFPFGDEPLGRTADEKFAYVEATLRTLELIPGS